jgi:hypothetical protein
MDSSQVIARFDAERQALALMDHPNIARVIDGGETPTGRPPTRRIGKAAVTSLRRPQRRCGEFLLTTLDENGERNMAAIVAGSV